MNINPRAVNLSLLNKLNLSDKIEVVRTELNTHDNAYSKLQTPRNRSYFYDELAGL